MRLPKATNRRRRGVTIVECAVVYPITFLLLLGLVVGALGIFRYQEVATLARAGARYASTHGDQFRKDAGWGTGQAGTADGNSNGYFWYKADPMAAAGSDTSWAGDMYDKAIRPTLIGIDPSNLTVKMGFPAVINQPNQPDNWPGSKVAVMVTYRWMPEVFFVGPIYLTSTSTMQITN